MKVFCKKDDFGLYYSFQKGKCYNYEKESLTLTDDYNNTYFYTTERFKEFFCSLSDLRKMKLKKLEKIYASSL